MVMAMVLKEKPLQEVKYKTNMVSPDFENFQQLLRAADSVDDSPRMPSFVFSDTSDIDDMQRENVRETCYRENEIRLLQQLVIQKIVYPRTLRSEVRSIRIIPSSISKRPTTYDESFPRLHLPSYDKWEADIVWGDDMDRSCDPMSTLDEALHDNYSCRSDDSRRWKRLMSGSNNSVSRKLRRVMSCGNAYVASGEWVQGIMWGDEDVLTIHEADIYADTNRVTPQWWSSSHTHTCRYDTDDDDEHYLYGEVIPLVHTSQGREEYLPLPPAPVSAEPASAAATAAREAAQAAEIAAAAVIAVPSKPTEIVKGPLYKQQKAREKKEKLDRLKALAFANVTGVAVAPSAVEATDPSAVATTEPNTGRRRRATTAELEHCIVAARHLNCKPYLRKAELKFFHRPLLSKLARVHTWHLTLEKKGSNKVSQTKGHIRQHLVSQISKASDLALTEGEFICIEYIEEHPNVLMNPGMASKILNYYRMPQDEETTKPVQSAAAAASTGEPTGGEVAVSSTGAVISTTGAVEAVQPGDMPSGSRKNGTAASASTGSAARVPRHVQQLLKVSSGGGRSGRGASSVDIPKLPEGITEVLSPQDKFPLLGDIEPGAAPQPVLHSNLFRAPLFAQLPRPVDFLLVRVPHKRGSHHFIVRRMNVMFTAGQQEPLMIVPKPSRKKLSQVQQNFLMLHLTRFFSIQGDVDVDSIDLEKEFDFFMRHYKADFKRCIRRVADEIDENTFRRKEWKDVTPADEYEGMLSPEDVCLMERGLSADFRLTSLGIVQAMEVSKIEQALSRMNKLKDFMRSRLKVATEMANVHRGTARGKSLAMLVDILEIQRDKLKKEIDVGRYIHEKSSLTPWVISESFVKAVVEKGGSELLRLSGLGDPSGIGEGFSLLRMTKSGPKLPGVENCSEERDLRKKRKVELDATLKTFGFDRATLKKIERWEKVDLVRYLANLAAEGNIATDLHRYARAPKQTSMSQAVDYRQRCVEIWKKQAAALSVGWDDITPEDEEVSGSDSDDSEDFDTDLSDVEEEVAAAQEAKAKAGSQGRSGPGRKKADADDSELQSLRTGAFFEGLEASGTATGAAAAPGGFSIGNESEIAAVRFTPPERVVKRITTTIKPDGTQVVEVRFIVSSVEVRRVLREQGRRSSTARIPANGGPGMSTGREGDDMGDIFEDDAEEAGLRLKFGRMKHKASLGAPANDEDVV